MNDKLQPGDKAQILGGEYAGKLVLIEEANVLMTALSQCSAGKAIWNVESIGTPFSVGNWTGMHACICGCSLRKLPPLDEPAEHDTLVVEPPKVAA